MAERRDWIQSRKCSINACSLRAEYILLTDAPRPTYASQCKSLSTAKQDYPDLKNPYSQVLQQTLLIPGEPAALFSTQWDPQEAYCWSLQELIPGPGYVAALAVAGEHCQLKYWQFQVSQD